MKNVFVTDCYINLCPIFSQQLLIPGDEVTPERVYKKEVEIVIPRWQGWARAAKQKLDEEITQLAARG